MVAEMVHGRLKPLKRNVKLSDFLCGYMAITLTNIYFVSLCGWKEFGWDVFIVVACDI